MFFITYLLHVGCNLKISKGALSWENRCLDEQVFNVVGGRSATHNVEHLFIPKHLFSQLRAPFYIFKLHPTCNM